MRRCHLLQIHFTAKLLFTFVLEQKYNIKQWPCHDLVSFISVKSVLGCLYVCMCHHLWNGLWEDDLPVTPWSAALADSQSWSPIGYRPLVWTQWIKAAVAWQQPVISEDGEMEHDKNNFPWLSFLSVPPLRDTPYILPLYSSCSALSSSSKHPIIL